MKIRDGAVANRPIYVALAVTAEGRRDILELWAGDGDEGAKHWMHTLTEIKNRSVNDDLMLVCDGLRSLPDELRALHRQFADQLREQRVLRVPADGYAQVAHPRARLAFPVRVQLLTVQVQEQHPAHVRASHRVIRVSEVQVTGQQGMPEGVPRQHVRTTAEHYRRDAIDGAKERRPFRPTRTSPGLVRCPRRHAALAHGSPADPRLRPGSA
ncbi:Transposase, Mutator family [Streptomyces sp. ADI92-24]|nr:Transposase, Mutator family [Streptomyces sp. ADI92-24]